MVRTKHLMISVVAFLGLLIGVGGYSTSTLKDTAISHEARVIFATPHDSYSVVSQNESHSSDQRDAFLARVRSALLKDVPDVAEEATPEETTKDPVALPELSSPIPEEILLPAVTTAPAPFPTTTPADVESESATSTPILAL